jgi:beta-lactam-binding protein with PASTA domain
VRGVGAVLLGIAGAFALGVLLFNYVLMPRLVRHGVTVPVPRLEGLAVAAAQQECTAAGLRIVEGERRHSETLPAGIVVTQSPVAGTAVKPGRPVRVSVSLGQERVLVPDLRGMSERQAELALENARLARGRTVEIRAGSTGRMVRASRPAVGAEAARGDSVDLLVATGDATEAYLMPSVVGQNIDDVRALAESRGFHIGHVTYRSSRGVYPGTVLEQDPPFGSLVRSGASIDLVVATPD